MFLGSMGSGKSSVVDAICYALYGTYPKLGRRDAKIENVRNFRYGGAQAAVELTWVDETNKADVREFRVRREVEPAGAWLYSGEKLICKGARAVRDEIEKILQIPYELFARAVYAEQNKLDYWLNLSSGERKTEIDSLLGLDKFENVRAGANREIMEIRREAQKIEQEIPQQKIEQAKEIAAKYNLEMLEGEKLLLEHRKTLEILEVQKKEIDAKFFEIEKAGKIYREQKEKIGLIGAKIEGLSKNIEQIKIDGDKTQIESILEREIHKIESDEKKILALEVDLKKIISDKSSMRLEISQNKGKVERRKMLEQRLAQILNGTESGEIILQKKELETNLQKMKEERATLKSRNLELAKIIEAFDVDGGKLAKCPMCDSQISRENFAKVRADRVAQKERAGALFSEIGEKILEDEKFLSDLSKRIEDFGRVSLQITEIGEITNLDEMNREFLKIEKRECEISAEIDEMRKITRRTLSETAKLRSNLEKIAQVQKWREELVNGQKEREDAQRGLLEIKFGEKEYEEIRVQKEKIGNEYSGNLQKTEGQKKICQQSKIIYEKQREEVEILEKRRTEANKLRERADELTKFREVVTVTQAQLRENLVGEINRAMDKLWPIIYPYGDWGSARILAGEKDYELQIHQGEWKNLEAHASGGERACLGLCMRAAMSVILTPHLGWLILDEPTHNLDFAAVRALGESISNSMPKIIPQILVITHDSNLLESANSRVLRFERDKLRGEDTQVFET